MLDQKRFWCCLLALGISSVSVQLIVIREVMSSFSGNELVIGPVLGLWLLFTGAGSALGALISRKGRPENLLFWGHILIATIPFFQVGAIRSLPGVWVRGEMLGLTPALFSSALIVLPFCLVGGGMIPVAGALLTGRQTASRVYVADTVGDIFGGLLFSLVFVYLLTHWQSLIVVGMLNLLAAGFLIARPRMVALLLCLMGGLVFLTGILDQRTLSRRFPGQAVLDHRNTPFAQLTITKTGGQINVLQDAIPLFSTDDLTMEAMAHLALCQVGRNADVLLIAGGVFGTVAEMSKHHPNRIDYVEMDPAIVELDQQLGGNLNRPFVHVHIGDGRLFVKQTERRYDAVIVDLPGPENSQLNRFYSRDFFREVQSILRPQGVLLFSLIGAENYLEEKALAVNRSVRAAVSEVFSNVLVLPGQIHYYLASHGPLTADIAPILTERSIVTKQLVDYDLSAMSDPFRIDQLKQILDEEKRTPNQDLSPEAFGDFLDLWMKKSGSSKTLLIALMMASVAIAGLACWNNRVQFAIMTTGFAAMTLELSLILIFQVIYGYVYLRICMFVTLFMIGSALGAFLAKKNKRDPFRTLIGADVVLIITALVGYAVCLAGVGLRDEAALALMQFFIIPGLIVAAAVTVGFQFSAASFAGSGSGSDIIGRLYLADLSGAACGTILTGLLFIPKIGIVGALLCVAAIKTVSLCLNVIKK